MTELHSLIGMTLYICVRHIHRVFSIQRMLERYTNCSNLILIRSSSQKLNYLFLFMKFHENELIKDKYNSCAHKEVSGSNYLNLVSCVDDILIIKTFSLYM